MPPFNNKSDMAEGEVFLQLLNHSAVFCSQPGHSKWYSHVLLALFTFAIPVGILGNVAALINYTRLTRVPWSTGDVFLFNLALCDSAWILTLPFTLYFAFQGTRPRGADVFCQFKRISFNVNVYGSIKFLTLVSFDRYVATVHPVSSLRWWGVGKARLCSLGTWAVLILSCVPDLCVTFAIQRPTNVTVCMDHILGRGPSVYARTVVSVIRVIVGFLLPFGAMLTFYAMTVRVLRRLTKCRGRRGAKRAGGKPLRLITAAIVVFAVSFVPYHVMIVTLAILRTNNQVTPSNTDVLFDSYEYLEAVCSVSCCLDPVLYIMASERFQRKLLALKGGLRCRTGRRVGANG